MEGAMAMEGAAAMEGATAMDGAAVAAMVTVAMDDVARQQWTTWRDEGGWRDGDLMARDSMTAPRR